MPQTIGELASSRDADGGIASGVVHVAAARAAISFRVRGCPPRAIPEAYIASALLPAMSEAQAVTSSATLSRRLASVLPTVQGIYSCWDPRLKSVSIKLRLGEGRQPAQGGRSALFFSGGLDSFYSLLRLRDQISAVIFVHGFDIALSRRRLRAKVAKAIGEVARCFDVELVEVVTNVRNFLDKFVHWELSHGAALASVAHVLSGRYSRIFIPATHTYADLFPWGSHPLLDPLWSTESLEIAHHGCDATRVVKAQVAASSEIALKYLRVCWENPNDEYNCGRCEKCVRTMVSLHIAGGLTRCRTFPKVVRVEDLKKGRINALGMWAYMLENIRGLKEADSDPKLLDVIRRQMRDYGRDESLWERSFWNPFESRKN